MGDPGSLKVMRSEAMVVFSEDLATEAYQVNLNFPVNLRSTKEGEVELFSGGSKSSG